jgi:hypothetical protein
MALDKEAFFRNWIDTLFLKTSWVDAVKQLTGITAVSQVWGERPEWYLWITGAAGPFNLALHHTFELASGRRALRQGLFAVKCYPYRESAFFPSFMEAERQLIESDRFDHTNTPRFEAQSEIPDTLFSVGALTITADAEGSFAVLTFETFDALCVVEGSSRVGQMAAGGSPPRRLRNVPGWDIGYLLFDRIIALYAFSGRRSPCYYRLTRAPGFEHSLTEGGQIIIRPAPSIRLFSASIVFSVDADVSLPSSFFGLPELETEEELLVEKRFPIGCGSSEELETPGVNPLWWQLATAEFACELTSTCGCSHG